MNKFSHLSLKRFDARDIKEGGNLAFTLREHQLSGVYLLIVAETWKHYYYLYFWYRENKAKTINTQHICCMEKSVMNKLVNIEKIWRLEDWNFNDQMFVIKNLIENLAVTKPRNSLGSVWLLGSMFPEYLPYCSVLKVYYDESNKYLLPDLIFCHPNIWNDTKSEWKETMLKEFEAKSAWQKTEYEKARLKDELKKEIARLEEKFEFHLENSIKDPINSVISCLATDLKAIFFYLKDLKKELKEDQEETE